MAHGTHCSCMMCTVGKKVGMIHDEHTDGKHEQEKEKTCMACSCPCDAHKEHTHS